MSATLLGLADRWADLLARYRPRRRAERPALAPWEEQRYFDFPRLTLIDASVGVPKTIAPADPQRVILVISNNGAIPIWISPANPGSVTDLILLTVNGIPWVLNSKDHGPMVAWQWIVTTGGAQGNLGIIEVRLKEWPT